MGDIIKDPATGLEAKKKKIKSRKAEIEELDRAMRKEFEATEKHLRKVGLPDEIMERHRAFTDHYDKNMKEVMANLHAAEQASTQARMTAGMEAAGSLFEKAKPRKKHKPLDPEKLPHRIAEPVHREPRTKPEEFKTESGATRISPSLRADLPGRGAPPAVEPGLARQGDPTETRVPSPQQASLPRLRP